MTTLKLQVLVLPHWSRAVHTTGFVPSGKKLPLGGLQVMTGAGSQSSRARTLKKTFVPLARHPRKIPDGHCSVGGTLSQTATVTVHVARSPPGSVAMIVTGYCPIASGVFGAGFCEMEIPFVPQLSVTVTGTCGNLPTQFEARTVKLVGHWMTGGVLLICVTVTAKEQFVL
jgi:hypothetical protein